jgi:hypothetical protein
MNESLLAELRRSERNPDPGSRSARRTAERAIAPPLADLHLDIMDDCAHGNVSERHRIAGLHVDLKAGDHLVSGRQTLRGDDVGLLTIRIRNERNEAGAVGAVFQPLDLATTSSLRR